MEETGQPFEICVFFSSWWGVLFLGWFDGLLGWLEQILCGGLDKSLPPFHAHGCIVNVLWQKVLLPPVLLLRCLHLVVHLACLVLTWSYFWVCASFLRDNVDKSSRSCFESQPCLEDPMGRQLQVILIGIGICMAFAWGCDDHCDLEVRQHCQQCTSRVWIRNTNPYIIPIILEFTESLSHHSTWPLITLSTFGRQIIVMCV